MRQGFTDEQFVRGDEHGARVLIFRQNRLGGQQPRADVGLGRAAQRALGIEVERRIFRTNFDPLVVPPDGEHTILPVIAPEGSALYNAVGAHRDVDVLPVQLLRHDRHVRFAGIAVAIEREQAIEAVAVFGQFGDGLARFLVVLVSLVGLLGEGRRNRHQRYEAQHDSESEWVRHVDILRERKGRIGNSTTPGQHPFAKRHPFPVDACGAGGTALQSELG